MADIVQQATMPNASLPPACPLFCCCCFLSNQTVQVWSAHRLCTGAARRHEGCACAAVWQQPAAAASIIPAAAVGCTAAVFWARAGSVSAQGDVPAGLLLYAADGSCHPGPAQHCLRVCSRARGSGCCGGAWLGRAESRAVLWLVAAARGAQRGGLKACFVLSCNKCLCVEPNTGWAPAFPAHTANTPKRLCNRASQAGQARVSPLTRPLTRCEHTRPGRCPKPHIIQILLWWELARGCWG